MLHSRSTPSLYAKPCNLVFFKGTVETLTWSPQALACTCPMFVSLSGSDDVPVGFPTTLPLPPPEEFTDNVRRTPPLESPSTSSMSRGRSSSSSLSPVALGASDQQKHGLNQLSVVPFFIGQAAISFYVSRVFLFLSNLRSVNYYNINSTKVGKSYAVPPRVASSNPPHLFVSTSQAWFRWPTRKKGS